MFVTGKKFLKNVPSTILGLFFTQLHVLPSGKQIIDLFLILASVQNCKNNSLTFYTLQIRHNTKLLTLATQCCSITITNSWKQQHFEIVFASKDLWYYQVIICYCILNNLQKSVFLVHLTWRYQPSIKFVEYSQTLTKIGFEIYFRSE